MTEVKTNQWSRVLSLGAIWPRGGWFWGPSLATGCDGSRIVLLKLARSGRAAIIAFDLDHAPGRRRDRAELLCKLQKAGWSVSDIVETANADDVASFQVSLPAKADEDRCASTGLLFAEWVQGADVVGAAFISTDHGLTQELVQMLCH